MPKLKSNEQNTIGKRLGRLVQQYDLRISHAKYTAGVYEEEWARLSATNQTQKATYAKVAHNTWKTYETNLAAKREELIKAIQEALIGYNEKQRKIWYAYFIEGLSGREIEDKYNLGYRNVYRMVSAMQEDMSLRFVGKVPDESGAKTLNWGAARLATFLTENPSNDYIEAVEDALNYGIIDIDSLEFDPDFQDFLEKGGKH